MNKLNTGVSYNSGTSSETSETQSVEENQQSDSVTPSGTNTPPIQNSGSRIPKSWKRMKDSSQDKDAESKRPPWRAVSISTLPKPDKNALLRAKLLDASRRLRATKTAVGVQTDIVPTKLMKEVSLGAQTDLILLKEVGMLTDGSYAKRRDGTEEYILTYSVPLMTDTIETVNVATQTLIPRLPGDAFLEACTKPTEPYEPKLLQQCSDSERKLLKQLAKIRKSVIPLTAKFNECLSDEESKENDSPTDTDTDNTTDTIKSMGSKHSLDSNDLYPYTTYRSSLLKPTHQSWYFEYDNELLNENKFHPYTITPNKPWNSFVPLALTRPYADFDLNLLLLAIDELIQESNRLADRIEIMSKNRDRVISASQVFGFKEKVKEFIPIIYEPPSEYWLPIIEEQEKVLAELKSFKGADIKKFEQYIEKLD
ncbi:hypothetical protein FF38_05053 [Lucilia cuprina]|uniref:Uncharacterized protein n=1 Tax=Lucilia cuprina TaxID=7375 RepID=A0A0L0CBC1_LUCCU|nr:hypothetical protein FF38_05053 [Lucilia cuprina]